MPAPLAIFPPSLQLFLVVPHSWRSLQKALQVQEIKVLLRRHELLPSKSFYTHRLLMVCPVSIAGNTRIANDILGTKIQDAFYSTAQLGENVVSNICRPFPPWNLSMPWNYFENSLTVYLSKAYVSYHCLFLSALTCAPLPPPLQISMLPK